MNSLDKSGWPSADSVLKLERIENSAEINRLTRLCEAKDAALREQHQNQLDLIEQREDVLLQNAQLQDEIMELRAQRRKYYDLADEAQAQIAMKDAALKECRTFIKCEEIPSREALEAIETALTSTSETVAAWRAKETEPLRRQIAELEDKLNK